MKGGEIIQLVGLVRSVASKVIDVVERDMNMKKDVKRGLQNISLEMRLVAAEIQSNEENQLVVHEKKNLLLKELANDIEDFVDLSWVPETSSLLFSAIGCDPREQILEEIKNFMDCIKKVREWKPDSGVGSGPPVATGAASWSAPPGSPEATMVGFQKFKDELVSQLQPAAEGQPQELRVISIVGCSGVGKTTLARAVYKDSCASGGYKFVSWVVASECSGREDLLRKVLTKGHILPPQNSTDAEPPHNYSADGGDSICSCPHTPYPDIEQMSLRHFLQDKRYLVVIDDVVRAQVWEVIKDKFPESGNGSRIIVTSSVHSVAAACSSGDYVHTMQGWGNPECERIFWQLVGQEPSPALKDAASGILNKCGGLPLALMSAAKYLGRLGQAARRVEGGLTKKMCEAAARALGEKILEGRDAEFVEINRALLQSYNNLPDYIHRSSLLYASVFPRDSPINSKILIRRLIAEGLVAGYDNITDEEAAAGCLMEFIDRSIAEPVLIDNARVAKFRVYSIMLEFVIRKAVAENFLTLVHKDDNKENVCAQGEGIKGNIFGFKVRRLSIQDSDQKAVDEAENGIDLSVVRSLTIWRSHLLNIQACKLLRVLDLGGCTGVQDIVRGDICKLRFLRYLSLRGTDVGNLPSEMRHLTHLETLDIRETYVTVVPIEVIKLSSLAHLFGRFELPHGITEERLKHSKLQTLGGVCIRNDDQSFENIIRHTGNLKKVKIYLRKAGLSTISPNKKQKLMFPNPTSGQAPTYISSFLNLIKDRFTEDEPLKTLSIISSDLFNEVKSFLEPPCAVTSIKLQGSLEFLPDTTTLRQLSCLNKLVLISTGLSCEALSALQNLSYLEYLKLAEGGFDARWWAGSFVVHEGGFPSLKRLCFECSKLPKVIFRPGSMTSLAILDLLCPCPEPSQETNCWYGVQGISDLPNLNEVILHHSTDDIKMKALKEAAIWHKNKPSVMRQTQDL